MKKFMDENNGHDKRLVNYINDICGRKNMQRRIIIIVRALCELYDDECREKIGFVPYNEDDIHEQLWDILTNICDDNDLMVIIHFCGFEV